MNLIQDDRLISISNKIKNDFINFNYAELSNYYDNDNLITELLSLCENQVDKLDIQNERKIFKNFFCNYLAYCTNIEYIKKILNKYKNINLSYSFSLITKIMSNKNIEVFEYVFKYVNEKIKNMESNDIIELLLLYDNISLDKLKIILETVAELNHLEILNVLARKYNLENFMYVFEIGVENQNDLTEEFELKLEPLAKFMDYRDYSTPYRGDLLMISSDSNSLDIVKYLLSLNLFSIQSAKKSLDFILSNPSNMTISRFCGNEFVGDKSNICLELNNYLNK
jgi:hypothetical protein